MKSVRTLSRSALTEDVTVDVCVVGAGIAGLSTGYHLARAGKKVMVIDKGTIGGGETGRTTAHLVTALDRRWSEIERVHGPDRARLAAESHSAAITQFEATVRRERIDCDFERLDGYLFGTREEDRSVLGAELDAAHRAGLNGVEWAASNPVGMLSLRFPGQARLHPLKYLAGLARAIEKLGGRICCDTQAVDIQGGRDAHVRTAAGRTIRAQALVVATNTPVNDFVTMHTSQAAYRTYVIGLETPHNAMPPGLFWDTEDPFHYVRMQSEAGADILLVGGEDHKTGQGGNGEDRFGRLESWARQHFPMAKNRVFAWSGQVIESVDGLAYIGKNPGNEENVFIVTGDCGNGMTSGAIAGILLADLIQAKTNRWAAVYDPGRVRLGAAGQFTRENLNVIAQYADLVTSGDIESTCRIPPGLGAIVRRGLTKIAAYRDEHGALHEFEAACPHLGCIVAWNAAEKTWDCPCHGSRFGALGAVLNGPALVGLTPGTDSAG